MPRQYSLFAALLLALCLLAPPARAHLTPNSEMRLSFGETAVLADVIIPQGDYAAATGNPVTNNAAALARARRYLLQTIKISSPTGEVWGVAFDAIAFEQISGPPDLHAVMRLQPPRAASPRRFDLRWRAIIGELPGHFVLVVVASDFAAGKLDGRRELAGSLQGTRTMLRIDRGRPSRWAGFVAAFRSGAHHITIGYDHMLFLLVSLLPLSFVARAGRWSGVRPLRPAAWAVLAVVTAFTIGHSLTLILAAALDLNLPAQPVEIVIAMSIALSAAHGWRPLFPGREAWVAGLFGLVHGLAFATLITQTGIGASQRALAILGFNLGIEAAQIALVIIAMPVLLVLARTPYGRRARQLLAALAMVLAMTWLAERAGGLALFDGLGTSGG